MTAKAAAEIATLRDKLLEHLEAALAITDETQDATAGYLIEGALDDVRAAHWPALSELPPSRRRKA